MAAHGTSVSLNFGSVRWRGCPMFRVVPGASRWDAGLVDEERQLAYTRHGALHAATSVRVGVLTWGSRRIEFLYDATTKQDERTGEPYALLFFVGEFGTSPSTPRDVGASQFGNAAERKQAVLYATEALLAYWHLVMRTDSRKVMPARVESAGREWRSTDFDYVDPLAIE